MTLQSDVTHRGEVEGRCGRADHGEAGNVHAGCVLLQLEHLVPVDAGGLRELQHREHRKHGDLLRAVERYEARARHLWNRRQAELHS